MTGKGDTGAQGVCVCWPGGQIVQVPLLQCYVLSAEARLQVQVVAVQVAAVQVAVVQVAVVQAAAVQVAALVQVAVVHANRTPPIGPGDHQKRVDHQGDLIVMHHHFDLMGWGRLLQHRGHWGGQLVQRAVAAVHCAQSASQ